MVGQKHSRWLFTKTNCSKNLQIKNQSLSCQVVSTLVSGHYMAFKHYISFATYLTANFGFIVSESCQTSFPNFCTQPSEIALLINSNLSRRPLLGGRSHFICYQLGCKLWLQSIQNHTRSRYHACVLHHLKLLCCSKSVRIWADALILDRLLT